jgi:HTH-type transcriptional regulator/antitoxin HigA
METMSLLTQETQKHWEAIGPVFSIRSEQEYDQAVKRLNELLDEIGIDEDHHLYGLLDTLGTLIHAYEEGNFPMPDCSGADMLRYFMNEHSLVQSDLPEIGSQGVISEILNGKRELNTRQIRLLARRFNVSPAVFF